MKKYILSALFITSLLFIPLMSERISEDVFSVKMKSAVVVIDVGHGGDDPGKVSSDGTEEKNVNLAIAKYLQDYLIAQDYTVYLTRDTDRGLYDDNVSNKKRSDLNNRIQFFKDKNADLVISVHQNSYPDASQHGAQTFYFKGREDSKLLAENVQDSLLSLDSTNKRKAKANDSYYLLKNTSVPAVIVECGFLSNSEETARLTDSNYQKDLAYAISVGVCRFLNGR
ncbi:MAG: N-acetylmuramoyl-L-alanine amidase [Lachnospiraceae bacterium]|nr:N-acetylmuramoyl-L-alanine amidase [Lachnospiraceae bacterium]